MDFYGDNSDARRAPREERVTHDIQNLWERQHEILNRKLLGRSNVSIANELGVTPATVSNTLNSTLGKSRLREMRFERNSAFLAAKQVIDEQLLPLALATYEEILTTDEIPISIKKATADTVTLQLAGLAAPQRIESLSVQVTAGQLDELKRRGREAARSLGILAPKPRDEALLVPVIEEEGGDA